MFIKQAGTYLALCDHYCMLFRAVGSFPFFKIPSALILNDYIRGGEVRQVKENDVEIQGLISNPSRFAIASLDSITDDCSFKEIDTMSIGVVELDPELEKVYIEKLKYIDMSFSGIHINSLIFDIVGECKMSIPQARLVICALRKKIKNERKSNTGD